METNINEELINDLGKIINEISGQMDELQPDPKIVATIDRVSFYREKYSHLSDEEAFGIAAQDLVKESK